MKVKVKNRLTGLGVDIDHRAVAGPGNSRIGGKLARNLEQVSHKGTVIGTNIIKRGDMFLWTDEDMNGRLRIDVVEREDSVVFENHLRWQFTFRNAAEQARFHRRCEF